MLHLTDIKNFVRNVEQYTYANLNTPGLALTNQPDYKYILITDGRMTMQLNQDLINVFIQKLKQIINDYSKPSGY